MIGASRRQLQPASRIRPKTSSARLLDLVQVGDSHHERDVGVGAEGLEDVSGLLLGRVWSAAFTRRMKPIIPSDRISHITSKRRCPGVPNRNRARSLANVSRPKSIATVVFRLTLLGLVGDVAVGAHHGDLADRRISVVFPALKGPVMTSFRGRRTRPLNDPLRADQVRARASAPSRRPSQPLDAVDQAGDKALRHLLVVLDALPDGGRLRRLRAASSPPTRRGSAGGRRGDRPGRVRKAPAPSAALSISS